MEATKSVTSRWHRINFVRVVKTVFWLCGLIVIGLIEARGATLKPETVTAWDAYIEHADQKLQERVAGNSEFLWASDDPKRAARVRAGAIVIGAAPGQNPKKVPSGLIHHWVGAMFVPNVTLDDVLEVTHDYDRYKEFFRPSVIDSKSVARDGVNDRFSMVLMNKELFLKTALDADYEAKNVRLDAHRFYSISKTTRVQEIQQYGHPGQHPLPEGHGGGYIWKLYSVSRIEETDGGVYIELEAMALSREIPEAFRVIANPIVRRVSQNAIQVSLQQTGTAVRDKTRDKLSAKSARDPGNPASQQPRNTILQ